MIWLITGASHTGKTLLAQRLLEKYHVPYLSIDHLKMGLIRSGMLSLTPQEDERLRRVLWPVVREMMKTALENRQHLIVEGDYIPFAWREEFSPEMLREIHFCCLILSEGYIRRHMREVLQYADVIERRLDDSDCTMERLILENQRNLDGCRRRGLPYCLVEDDYQREIAQAEQILDGLEKRNPSLGK